MQVGITRAEAEQIVESIKTQLLPTVREKVKGVAVQGHKNVRFFIMTDASVTREVLGAAIDLAAMGSLALPREGLELKFRAERGPNYRRRVGPFVRGLRGAETHLQTLQAERADRVAGISLRPNWREWGIELLQGDTSVGVIGKIGTTGWE